MPTRATIERAFLIASLTCGLSALGACQGERPATTRPSARELVRARGIVRPPAYATHPLTAVRGPDPQTVQASLTAAVDSRLLVITADGTDPAFDAIVQALKYMGAPYDVFNATSGGELTAARLTNGAQGRYQGIILDVGNLSVGNTSA